MSRHALERLCGICGVIPRRIVPTLRRLDPFVEETTPGHYDPDAIYVLFAITGKPVMDWSRTYRRALECKGWLEAAAGPSTANRRAAANPPRARPARYRRASRQVQTLRRLAGLRRRSIAYWKHRFEEVCDKLKKTEKELESLRAAGKEGKAKRYFSPRGGLTMALRRALANAPAVTWGLAMQTNISHKTVNRWEVILDNSLRASCRESTAEFMRGLETFGGYAIHLVRADATNAKMWHQCKAMLAEYQSLYCFDTDDHAGIESTYESNYMGDIQIVHDASGIGCRAMILHMCRSIGFPTWVAAVQRHGEVSAAETLEKAFEHQLDQLQSSGRERQIEVYLWTTDHGPDQVKCRRLAREETSACLFVFTMDSDCLNHAGHNGVKTCLKCTEWIFQDLFEATFGYFSALATLCNVWRENGRAIYATWSRLYSGPEAVRVAKSAPPRCLVGRWGSADGCEERVLRPSQHCLRAVFEEFANRQSAKRRRAKTQPATAAGRRDHELEQLRADDCEHHSEIRGKWMAMALLAVRTQAWLLTVQIANRSRAGFAHLHRSILKTSKMKSQTPESLGFMAELVFGKSDEIMAEFAAVISFDAWADILAPDALLAYENPHVEERAEHAATIACLQAAAEYHLRIHHRTLRYPERFLLLAKEPPGVACNLRRAVCAEMLSINEADAEINVLKLRVLFRQQLQRCADTGLICTYLHGLILSICQRWVGDTQAIEGLNSILKNIICRAPHIQQPLVSARLSLRRALGTDGGYGQVLKKFSQAPRGINHF